MTAMLATPDVSIHRIIESEARFFKAREFFPALSAELLEENRHWMQPVYLDAANDGLVFSIQSHILKTKHHTILIDACVGNHKDRPAYGPWHQMAADTYERALAAAGVSFADIDYVMCTHLHVDHVGWNTRLENGRWVPTFPNARYVFAERELAFWTERQKTQPELCPWITDSVLPIVAAQRSDVVANDFAFNDHIRFIPTPGHTIDHVSVEVGKGRVDALITGDMIHSPIQGRYPEISMVRDFDGAQSARTRRALFERFCDTDTKFCMAHFPSPDAALVKRWGDGFRFEGA
jgi:glyoxylase-like metal-dependent hydrolase (beta-lactamase superfamily II)